MSTCDITFKSKLGAGRDGKLGPKSKAEVQDPAGNVMFYVKGRLLGIPKRMNITQKWLTLRDTYAVE